MKALQLLDLFVHYFLFFRIIGTLFLSQISHGVFDKQEHDSTNLLQSASVLDWKINRTLITMTQELWLPNHPKKSKLLIHKNIFIKFLRSILTKDITPLRKQ